MNLKSKGDGGESIGRKTRVEEKKRESEKGIAKTRKEKDREQE